MMCLQPKDILFDNSLYDGLERAEFPLKKTYTPLVPFSGVFKILKMGVQ